MRQPVWAFIGLTLSMAVNTSVLAGEDAAKAFALHGQGTWTDQSVGNFSSTAAGPNSLHPNQKRSTFDATVYAGMRISADLESWVNLEIDQGFGLDNTLGMAGFPSGEAYKVGRQRPYLRLQRVMIRKTFNLSQATESVEADANQFSGKRSSDRWVLTAGKFGVTDLFDVSQYAHDPRRDFLNWTAIDAGTFDYAADAWGFTAGAAIERYTDSWVGRLGLFDLSTTPNSTHLTPAMRQYQWIGEIEHHIHWAGHDGKWLLTVYDSHGQMGRLISAINAAGITGLAPELSQVRARDRRLGFSGLIEQRISPTFGAFLRIGRTDGRIEAYEFTDIDRSLELGLSVSGTAWNRPLDTVGLALMRNGISPERIRYLALGGLGILVGDGALPHPGTESIGELYYARSLGHSITLTADLQHVLNPAYNRDRGPVLIGAIRLHTQF
jgi:high affinity Mn2+ porin